MNGKHRRALRSRSLAPSRSCTLAGWTATLSRRPRVSTRMWRLRPMTFLPHQSLAGRAQSRLLSRLAALAVDDRRRRARFAPGPLARLDVERVMDALQRAVPIPQAKVVVRRALRRQILGQSLPLAAGRQHIEDGVQDFADVHLAPSTATLGRRDHRLDQPPFGIRQVAGISQTRTSCHPAVFCCPHVVPPSVISTTYRITTDSLDSTTLWIGSKPCRRTIP